MYRSILVALDGSAFAEHSLPYALALARRSSARLVLVTVSTPLAEAYVEGLYFSTVELEQEITARHQAYLDGISKKIKAICDVPLTVAVKHGEVASTLCDMVAKGEADLVMLATHGRGAMSRFWLGSVADEMIRQSTVPVMLVRPDSGAPDLRFEPDLSRIVLPLDGSELAEHILEHAVRLAKMIANPQLILLRAIHAIIPIDMAPDVPSAEKEARTLLSQVQALQVKLRQDAEQYLADVAAKLKTHGVEVITDVVVEDQPAQAILQEVETRKGGLVAIETHGRRGLSRLISGSVTDKVIRGSHVPVLVHHQHHA